MKKYIYLLLVASVSTSVLYGQSANWTAVLPAKFPTNVSGQIHGISRVSQMKFHPTNPNKMYAVSARGGLFISSDGGANWTVTPGTDFMPYARLASVCIDHTNDQVIYLGTGDHNYYYSGNGVMKSVNGGQTFTQTTLTGKLVVEMIMDPTDNNVIVAATHTGIYKTINAGATWTLKTASRAMDDLKQKTPTSRVLYAAGKDSSFFRSNDFGDTWTQITNGIVLPTGFTNGNGVRIAVTPADTNVVYLGMVVNGGTIYKSTDGGSTFTAVKNVASPYLTYYANSSTSSGQGDYNFSIGADRINSNILYLVAHNVWKSTDGGVTWSQLTNWWQKVHTDMHQIITSPYNNANLYNMNDGGVWLSTDGGNNWTPKSDGIYGYEIYHGNCSPTRKDMFSIGTQDNGELYATSLGWYCNRGGDWGSQCAFDYRTNSSMVYYYSSNKRRLVTGGESTYGLPAQVTSLHDIAFNRSNADLAFVADSFIYRTTNLTASTPSWAKIDSSGKKIMAMHSAFGNSNRLYYITNDQVMHVSNNALNATPTFVTYVLPNTTNNRASITSIKSNPDVVYITCNTKTYRSADGGATWINITYNLPSTNHIKIIADEYSPSNELVFIATNNAVYYKVANANTWTIFNTNLPTRTDAIDMSIYNDSTPNSSLRFANYGRGMWETPINSLRALNAIFAASNTNPCTGESVTFNDMSTGTITGRTWTFTGATPSTSTLQNPVVVYNGNGKFNVSLNITDGISNNTLTKTNYINTNGSNLPLIEGFETEIDPPSGWTNVDNGTTGYKWAKISTAGGFGNSINSMLFDNYSWNVPGEKDELKTMRLDLNNYNAAQLTFDVAYQVFSGYSDTLAVLISTDCGNTFTKVYSKGGNTLSTAGSGGNNFVPTASQWRTDTILLNAYLNQNIIVAFQNINGYGNKLYLDNIKLNATVTANAGPDKNICQGSSTTIGSAPLAGLTYAWSPATGLSSSTVSNPTASPAVTTTYIVTATQSSSGISSTDTVVVNVDVITINFTTIQPCNGANGGILTNITTGVAPFSYLWSNGATTSAITNISAGSYSVTVTDANGCTKNGFAYLQPSTPPVVSLSTTNTTCGLNNGAITSTVNGGIGGQYTYLWSTGSTASSVSGLTAGTYSLTVISGGCSTTAIANVNASTGISVSLLTTQTSCGLNNGLLSAIPSGGSSYTYQWSNGAFSSSINQLSPGTYTVTVTDPATNCTAMAIGIIGSSTGLTVSASPSPTTCGQNNGIITTSVSGGSNYTYLWSNGLTYNNLFLIGSGTYTVTVTSGGCTATASATVYASQAVTVLTSNGYTTCGLNNGMVSAVASGGTNYTYLWSNGQTMQTNYNLAPGTYTVTVSSGGCTATAVSVVFPSTGISVSLLTTQTSCGFNNGLLSAIPAGGTSYTYQWSNGAFSSSINQLSAGTYTVTVTDPATNCTATASGTINSSLPFSVSLITENTSCGLMNGNILAVTSGGTYVNYQWSNGSTNAYISSLGAGTYTVTASSGGCTATASATVNPSLAVTLTLFPNNTTCGLNNGAIGTGTNVLNPTYMWSNGATTGLLTQISPGTYTLTVTSNGCTASASTVINSSTGISVSLTSTPTTCGLNNGNAFSVAGGGNNYYYVWSNGATNSYISNVAGGTYTITVTDSVSGCYTFANTIIGSSMGVQVNQSIYNTSCGLNNGLVVLNVVSGTPPYNYLWSTGNTVDGVSALPPGTYYYTVTDSLNCSKYDSATVTANNSIIQLNIGTITTNSIALSWNAIPYAVSYNLRYRISGNINWITINNITNPAYTLTGLSANTIYEIQAQANCGAGSTGFTPVPSIQVTTAGGCADAYEPNNTTTTSKLIVVNTNINGLINPAGDADWFKFNTSNTKRNVRITLTGLPANYNVKLLLGSTVLATSANSGLNNEQIIYNDTAKTTYKIKVYAGANVFNALNCYTLKAEISATPFRIENTEAVAGNEKLISVYPNPANDELTISGHETSIQKIELFDLSGRKISAHNYLLQNEIKFNTSGLESGYYLMHVTTGEGLVTVKVSVLH